LFRWEKKEKQLSFLTLSPIFDRRPPRGQSARRHRGDGGATASPLVVRHVGPDGDLSVVTS
jgi:hypothetical protein